MATKIQRSKASVSGQGEGSLVWQGFSGGIADSLWSGIRNSFYKVVGLDVHSSPGSVTVQQKLTKDSGTTITDLCNVSVALSDGSQLFFSYTSGKIWRLSGGTYTLVYTTVPTTGTAGCYGACEFNGNIYWATQNYLHYCTVSSVSNFAGVVPNWRLFTVTDSAWHPMVITNAKLFIGDGNQIASVDSANTFTEAGNVLKIIAPLRIRTMAPLDIDLILGTYIDPTVNFCYIIRWDTVQTTWQYATPIWENGVNAFMWIGETLIAQCGQFGMLYQYTGRSVRPFKRIPGTWSPTSYGDVKPNAVGVLQGKTIFGLSNGSGNPADEAVYTLGSYSKDYPIVLTEDFPISSGNFSGVTIGSILVVGTNMYVAWQDASGQGVDKLDYSNKYASAYLETIVINLDALYEGNVYRWWANYQSMPAGTSINFQYYKNHQSLVTPTNSAVNSDPTVSNGVGAFTLEESVDGRVLRIRMNFVVSGNSAPVIESLNITPGT